MQLLLFLPVLPFFCGRSSGKLARSSPESLEFIYILVCWGSLLVHFIILDHKLWCLRLLLVLELMVSTEQGWGRQWTAIALVVLVHSFKEVKWGNIWSEQLVNKSMPLTNQDEVTVVSLIKLIFWTLVDACYFPFPHSIPLTHLFSPPSSLSFVVSRAGYPSGSKDVCGKIVWGVKNWLIELVWKYQVCTVAAYNTRLVKRCNTFYSCQVSVALVQ